MSTRNNPENRVDRMRSAATQIQELLSQPHVSQHFPQAQEIVRQQEKLLASIAQRADVNPAVSVIAFAGPSGTGKSSLINAFTRCNVCPTGVRRPTTTEPVGVAVQGSDLEEIAALLGLENISYFTTEDTEIFENKTLPKADLLLVDLPDFELVQDNDKGLAAKILLQADVIVWVTDPQKYADDSFHRKIASFPHYGNTMIVLTHSDALNSKQQDIVLNQLQSILADHGCEDVEVYPLSLRDDDTLASWNETLWDIAANTDTRWMAMQSALKHGAIRLREACSVDKTESLASLPPDRIQDFLDAVARASGADVIETRLKRGYLGQAAPWVIWPPLGWLSGLKPQQKKSNDASTVQTEEDTEPVVESDNSYGMLASPTQVMQAANDIARLGKTGIPRQWEIFLGSRAKELAEELTGAMNLGLESWQLPKPPQRRWWMVWHLVQWALLLVLVVSSLWLLIWGVFTLGGQPFPVSKIAFVPVPFWLFIIGTGGAMLWTWQGMRLSRRGAQKFAKSGRNLFRRISDEVTRRAFLEPLKEDQLLFAKLRELSAQMGCL